MKKGNSLDPTLAGGEVLSGTGALAPVPYSGFASAYAQPLVSTRYGKQRLHVPRQFYY
jgi:hypothetical protein